MLLEEWMLIKICNEALAGSVLLIKKHTKRQGKIENRPKSGEAAL